MTSTRNLLRNTVLNYLPPRVAHYINMAKNVHLGVLEAEMRIVPDLVHEGSVVVDVGANLGLYADIFAQKARKVIAIEPQPQLAAYLRKVLPANVEIIETALSAEPGEAELRIPRFSKGALGSLDAFATIEKSNDFGTVKPLSIDIIKVPLKRLDDVVGNEGPVSFVKIDVEGHENGVVAGSLATIDRDRPVLMIELEPRHNPKCYELFDLLTARGYAAWCLDQDKMTRVSRDDAARLQNWTPDAGGAVEGTHNFAPHVANFIFCHAADERQAFLSSRQ